MAAGELQSQGFGLACQHAATANANDRAGKPSLASIRQNPAQPAHTRPHISLDRFIFGSGDLVGSEETGYGSVQSRGRVCRQQQEGAAG